VRVTTKYGTDYFGDGCLRMTTPLSPAIRLGAEKILAIGVRHKNPKLSSGDSEKNQAIVKAVEIESIVNANNNDNQEPPSIAQILGVTFNAIFLDHLDTDVEHLIRLNEIIRQGGLENQHLGSLKEPMKIVTPLAISPSEDIGRIAEQHSKKMPKAVKYLMAGLTTKKSSGSDLLSYLLFDTSFTTALVDLGYKDASARIDEIEHFLAPVAANAIVESKYNESSGVENKIPKIGSRIS
jgi:NTE family protein